MIIVIGPAHRNHGNAPFFTSVALVFSWYSDVVLNVRFLHTWRTARTQQAIAKSAKANPNDSILAMLKAGVGVTINNGVVNPMDPAAAQRALKRHQQVNSTRAASAPLPATIAKASQLLAPEPKKSDAARAPTTVASSEREPPLEVEPEPDAIENESGGSSAGAGAGAGAGGGLGSITLPTTIADDGVSTLSMLSLSSAPATQTRTDGASSLEWLSFEAQIADVLEHH